MSSIQSKDQSVKYKTYLIEKLLNESPLIKTNESIIKIEDKEDLVSETGTYTIEDELVNDKKQTELNKVTVTEARAAIDEKFGIMHQIENDLKKDDDSNLNLVKPKRHIKTVRARNQTYSLTKDLLNEEMSKNDKLENQIINDKNEPNSICSTSSASSSSHSMQDSKIKKTITYDVIADKVKNEKSQILNLDNNLDNTINSTNLNTSRTVATNILLGDTENLIKQLKKRSMEKKQSLQSKLLNINQKNDNLSSSSASSSSTNLSNDVQTMKPQTWTIPNESNLVQQEPINIESFSTRATVNFDQDEEDNDENKYFINQQNKKLGSSGMSFELNLNDNLTNPVKQLNATKFQHLNTTQTNMIGPENSLTNRSNTNQSIMTITRGFESRKSKKETDLNLNSSLTSSETPINTPKSNATSAISLGAKIQAKAKENSTQSTPRRNLSEAGRSSPTQTQYTNRTLFLRQQTAKAKRDLMEKNEENEKDRRSSVKTLTTKQQNQSTSILKKQQSANLNRSSGNLNTNNLNINHTPSTPTTPKGKQSSRITSRNSSPSNNLMTTSLNIPNGGSASLPVNLIDSFQRRKNYDPMKSVRMEKLKRQSAHLEHNLKQSGSIEDCLSLEYNDFNSDNSFVSLPNQLENNKNIDMSKSLHIDNRSNCLEKKSSIDLMTKSLIINNNDNSQTSLIKSNSVIISDNSSTYEKILQSTLQRLSIRLIQMSTSVLDKIGDNRSNLCDSIQFLNGTNELERMQTLTKLVHSMQLVHDHMQVIDITMFNKKSDDNYIKELTKIRQEVDILKQSAVLNSPKHQFN